MTRWFTADLHLGHTNIIRYCDRPFADADDMNAVLVERWNDVVAAGDEVWVLGDVALGRIADTLPLVRRLHGRKVLVAGNHDRCWAGHRKGLDRWTKEYRSVGFAAIHQGVVEVELGGQTVLACHFPYRGDSQDEERHVGHRPTDRGQWLLHGHVHDRWKVEKRQINVGVDVWDYRPVAEDTLAAAITGTAPALVPPGPPTSASVRPDARPRPARAPAGGAGS